MNKLRTANHGMGGAQARAQTRGAARAVKPATDTAPNLDTGVLFVGEAMAPPTLAGRADALAPFTRLVGPALGPANPAWGADALSLLRSLQKRLLEHALRLPAASRRGCLDAIAVLEPAVGMRLRIMQMQMSELDGSGVRAGATIHTTTEAADGAPY